jgi:multisubunit Na+/H+ antiporter MnhB subunit
MKTASKAGLVACAVLALALFYAASAMPAFGQPRVDSALLMLKGCAGDTGAANAVCAVVLDYRGYDTLGEATLLTAAVAGIVAVLKVGKS